MGKDHGLVPGSLSVQAIGPPTDTLRETLVHIPVFSPYPMTDDIFQNVLPGGRKG